MKRRKRGKNVGGKTLRAASSAFAFLWLCGCSGSRKRKGYENGWKEREEEAKGWRRQLSGSVFAHRDELMYKTFRRFIQKTMKGRVKSAVRNYFSTNCNDKRLLEYMALGKDEICRQISYKSCQIVEPHVWLCKS